MHTQWPQAGVLWKYLFFYPGKRIQKSLQNASFALWRQVCGRKAMWNRLIMHFGAETQFLHLPAWSRVIDLLCSSIYSSGDWRWAYLTGVFGQFLCWFWSGALPRDSCAEFSSWPYHSWYSAWCLHPTSVWKMALSENNIYFSDFFWANFLLKVHFKYRLVETPVQLGINPYWMHIFAVEEREMPKTLWISSKPMQGKSWNWSRDNEAVIGTMQVNSKDFSLNVRFILTVEGKNGDTFI